MRQGIIYKATNITNNKSYIGYTINFRKRQCRHIRDSFSINDKGYHTTFHCAIRKYGQNNIKWETLCECIPEQYLGEYEKWYIWFYNTYKYGYNETEGGDINPMHYPEIRKKLIGRRHTEETKRKMRKSKIGKLNPMFGKIFSKEHKRKIGEANKGKHISKETKQKMSASMMGSKNPMFGKIFSEEHKRKISESNTGIPLSKNHKEKIVAGHCKSIYKVTDPNGNTFTLKNIKQFCRDNNLNHGTMYMVINGKRKSHNGYKCIRLSKS